MPGRKGLVFPRGEISFCPYNVLDLDGDFSAKSSQNCYQVYHRKSPSVTLWKGVYQVADILAVILLLCEQFQQFTAEERHESLSFTLYHLRLELKEELKKELVVYQGILFSEPEVSYVSVLGELPRRFIYGVGIQWAN